MSRHYLDVMHDEARLFDLKTGQAERLLSAMDSVHNARWSPRKQGIVAIGCNRGLIAIYDVNSKQVLNTILPPDESYGLCEDLRWCLGESLLLVRYTELPGTLHLVNTESNTVSETNASSQPAIMSFESGPSS